MQGCSLRLKETLPGGCPPEDGRALACLKNIRAPQIPEGGDSPTLGVGAVSATLWYV